jgi:hypothetical protein
MASGNYDIFVEQGTTFTLYMNYKNTGGTAINLSGYTAEMQVRRSAEGTKRLLQVDGNGVTGGGSTGEWTPGTTFQGVLGTGGISVNTGTGSGVLTGGIYINVNATTTANLPMGNHVYDLQLVQGATVDRILQGRFVVDREVTR